MGETHFDLSLMNENNDVRLKFYMRGKNGLFFEVKMTI